MLLTQKPFQPIATTWLKKIRLILLFFSLSLAGFGETLRPCQISNDTTTISDTICPSGLPYIWNGQNYNTSGTYYFTPVGSSSTSRLILLVLPAFPPRPSRPAGSSGNRIFCQGQTSQLSTNTTAPQVLWEVFPSGVATFLPPLQGSSISIQWSGSYSGKIKIIAKAQNACGISQTSDTLFAWVLPLTGGKLPRPKSQDSVLCQGSASSKVISDFPASQFLWALAPPNAGLLAGNGDSIRVNWNPGFTGTAYIFFNSVTPCGFKKSDSLQIRIKPNLPTSILNLDSVYCQRQATVVLEGQPPQGQFFINDTVTDPFFSIETTGIYSIRYRVEGCYLESSRQVRVKAQETASIVGLDSLFCAGISPQPLTGSPPNGIFEVNGIVRENFQAADSGVYTVNYRAFCTDTAKQKVRVLSGPDASIRYSGPGICQDQLPAPIRLNPPGGQLWVNGTASPAFIPSAVGIYTLVYAVIADNCQAADTVEVRVDERPQLLISLENPEKTTFCRRDSLVNVSGWPAGGYFSPALSSASGFNPGNLPPGKQKISYLGLNGVCLDSASVDITIREVPDVFAGIFSDSLCEGGPVLTLSSGNPAGGIWSGPGVNGNIFRPDLPGKNILSYNIPPAGDSLCAAFDTATVFVKAAPKNRQAGDTSLCSNAPYTWSIPLQALKENPGISYRIRWQDGSNAGSQIISAPGTYHFTATWGNCSWNSDTMKVKSIYEPPVLAKTGIKSLCNFDSAVQKGPSGMQKYQWILNGLVLSEDSVFQIPEEGKLVLEVSDVNKCRSRQELTIRKIECPEIYIPEAFSPNGDGVNEVWKVFGKSISAFSVTVFNSWGEAVFSGSGKESAWDGKFLGSPCPAGAYQYILQYSAEPADREKFSERKAGQIFLIR